MIPWVDIKGKARVASVNEAGGSGGGGGGGGGGWGALRLIAGILGGRTP